MKRGRGTFNFRKIAVAWLLAVAIGLLVPTPHSHAAPAGHHSDGAPTNGAMTHAHDHQGTAEAAKADPTEKGQPAPCCHGVMSGCSGISFLPPAAAVSIRHDREAQVPTVDRRPVEQAESPPHRPPKTLS